MYDADYEDGAQDPGPPFNAPRNNNNNNNGQQSSSARRNKTPQTTDGSRAGGGPGPRGRTDAGELDIGEEYDDSMNGADGDEDQHHHQQQGSGGQHEGRGGGSGDELVDGYGDYADTFLVPQFEDAYINKTKPRPCPLEVDLVRLNITKIRNATIKGKLSDCGGRKTCSR
jgi:hypothetical protein